MKIIFMLAACFLAACVSQIYGGEGKMKTLVVYYSYTGKTATVAKAVAAETGAEIRPVEDLKRPSMLAAYFSGCFKAMKGRTVEIKPVDFSLKDYDTVYVGSPVWAGSPAPAINTFVANADFTGKKVVVFATMGGARGSSALDKMSERITKKGGTVIGSFVIRSGGQSDEALAAKAKESLKGIKK